MKVAAIGDNVVDIYLDQKQMYLGGNALNFANFATRFPGVKSMYIGNFGSDDLSEYVQQTLKVLSVDYHYASVLSGESGYSRVTLKAGDRVFVDSNKGGVLKRGISVSKTALTAINKTDLVHFNVNGNADQYLSKIYGPKIVYDYSDFSTIADISRTIKWVDIACFSKSDMNNEILGNFLLKVRRLEHKPGLTILVTRGAQGADVMTGDLVLHQNAESVSNIVDTMGAGDAFITAFSITLCQTADLSRSLRVASRFSANQIQVNGSFDHGVVAPNQYLK